jgi:hypothetical protein
MYGGLAVWGGSTVFMRISPCKIYCKAEMKKMRMAAAQQNTQKRHTQQRQSATARPALGESGMSSLFALLCIAALALFYQHGREYLVRYLGESSPYLNMFFTLGLLLLVVAVLFSTCAVVHLRLLGDSSYRSLYRRLRNANAEIIELINVAKENMTRVEREMVSHSIVVTPRATECLGAARRIIRALERRSSDVSGLIESGDKFDLLDAEELIRKKLIIADNAYEALIDADPIPPLDYTEWYPTLVKLFETLDDEMRRIAA